MKTKLMRVMSGVLGALALASFSGCTESQAGNEPPLPPTTAEAPLAPGLEVDSEAPEPEFPAVGEQVLKPGTEIAAAGGATNAVKLVKEITPPENLKTSPVVQEIVKLAEAGVNDQVILAYVTNSPGEYRLSSDEILYLNDLGVSSEVLTAMLRRGANSDAAPAQPFPPGPVVTGYAPITNAAPLQATAPIPSPPAQTTPIEAPLTPPEQAVSSTTTFYDSLSPYGNWVEEPDYGLVWQPTVVVLNPYWRPYCDRGRWVWTDCGWYWYSDYSWGWAAFHYGRWTPHVRLGWVWVPDTVWGPSWVSWRHSGDYCGWAPLPPWSRFRPGVGFTFHSRIVGATFDFNLAPDCYTFVPLNRFHDRNPRHYALSVHQSSGIFRQTVVVNNYASGAGTTVINRGFGKEPVVRATGRDLRTIAVREASVAPLRGRGEQLANNGSTIIASRPPLQQRQAALRESARANRSAAFSAAPASVQAVPSASSAVSVVGSRSGRSAAKPWSVAKVDSTASAQDTTPLRPTQLDRPGSRNQNTVSEPPSRAPMGTQPSGSGYNPNVARYNRTTPATPVAPRSQGSLVPSSPATIPDSGRSPSRPGANRTFIVPSGTERPEPLARNNALNSATRPSSSPAPVVPPQQVCGYTIDSRSTFVGRRRSLSADSAKHALWEQA